jgi:hypothetical protein
MEVIKLNMTKPITEKEMESRFSYHPPKELQIHRYTVLRDKAKEFAYFIDELVVDCREKDIAIQKVEEAVMWANAGIARRDE